MKAESNSPSAGHRSASSTADPVVILPGESGPRGGGPAGELAGLQLLAHLLDSAFYIPGLNIRFGVDALLGLIPGLGDVGTSLMSLAVLREANRRGVSKVTMTRMTANLLIDAAMGSIPILGDAFDIYWKANQRNVKLLSQHAAADPKTVRRARVGDGLFFGALIFVVLACLFTSLTIAYLAIRWIGTQVFGG